MKIPKEDFYVVYELALLKSKESERQFVEVLFDELDDYRTKKGKMIFKKTLEIISTVVLVAAVVYVTIIWTRADDKEIHCETPSIGCGPQ